MIKIRKYNVRNDLVFGCVLRIDVSVVDEVLQ